MAEEAGEGSRGVEVALKLLKRYTKSCVAGERSVWSLRVRNIRIATIDLILPRLDIFQVRGYANALPSETELDAVRHWAATEGLGLHARFNPVV